MAGIFVNEKQEKKLCQDLEFEKFNFNVYYVLISIHEEILKNIFPIYFVNTYT